MSTPRLTMPYVLLLASLCAALAVALLLPPIPQWPQYHQFADQRSVWGIPHFANTLSNLPFSLIGILGLRWLARHGTIALRDLRERWPWTTFFAGLLLLGPASGYYHLDPNHFGLMIDRIAMSILFMGWLAVHLAERLSPPYAVRALPFLLLIGIGSVLGWYASELAGRGDLRPWGYVQFWPIFLVLWLVWQRPPRYSHGQMIPLLYLCYAAALGAEALDHSIYRLTGELISGHTLKHLLAALAAYLAYHMLCHRRPL